jgi:hypothetical protein
MADERAPTGFGKGVNDYLNFYITLADAKAAGFLAAGLTVGAALPKVHPATGLAICLWWLALVAIGASVAFNAYVIFPRLPSGRRGLVFWEDIRTRHDFHDFYEEVARLTDADIEKEYAAQNHVVSGVVHDKHKWVRRGIVLFLIGTAATLAAYLLK